MNRREHADYEFLIQDFLDSYRFYHSEAETEKIIKKIIEKKNVTILPEYLKVVSKEFLSIKLSRMILNKLEDNPKENEELKKYLPIIYAKYNPVETKKKKYKLKRVGMIGLITALCITTGKLVNQKQNVFNQEKIKTQSSENRLEIFQEQDFFDSCFQESREEEIAIEKRIAQEKERIKKELEEQKRKEKILNNYSKCKTIEDIKTRQKQLESIEWKKSDKIYKKCKLSAPVQRFIYEQSLLNEWPVDFTFSIIYAETRGGFTSSGEVSYNAPNNYDLGLTQQNTVSSLETFRKKYKISYDKAFKLLKNNDYANICSAFLEYQVIAERFDEYDPYEFAGCYNGWLNWRNNSISRAYVKEFKKAYNNIFTKHHNIEKVKSKEKVKEKNR